jgi:hypothetical protein
MRSLTLPIMIVRMTLVQNHVATPHKQSIEIATQYYAC